MVQQTIEDSAAHTAAHPRCKLDRGARRQVVHLGTEGRAGPSRYLHTDDSLRYHLRLDRLHLGAVIQEVVLAIAEKRPAAMLWTPKVGQINN